MTPPFTPNEVADMVLWLQGFQKSYRRMFGKLLKDATWKPQILLFAHLREPLDLK